MQGITRTTPRLPGRISILWICHDWPLKSPHLFPSVLCAVSRFCIYQKNKSGFLRANPRQQTDELMGRSHLTRQSLGFLKTFLGWTENVCSLLLLLHGRLLLPVLLATRPPSMGFLQMLLRWMADVCCLLLLHGHLLLLGKRRTKPLLAFGKVSQMLSALPRLFPTPLIV